MFFVYNKTFWSLVFNSILSDFEIMEVKLVIKVEQRDIALGENGEIGTCDSEKGKFANIL